MNFFKKFLIKMMQFINTYNEGVNKILSEPNISQWTIIGNPGTGKTTQVPTLLAKAGKTVFVCMATKLSAISAASYIEQGLIAEGSTITVGGPHKNPNFSNPVLSVMKNFLNEKNRDSAEVLRETTKIVFCTNGQFVNYAKMIYEFAYIKTSRSSNGNMQSFCDYLIIDESHMRTKDQEKILSYFDAFSEAFPNFGAPKIIKMTATQSIRNQDAYCLCLEQPMFGRTIYYLDTYISERFDKKTESNRKYTLYESIKYSERLNFSTAIIFFLRWIKEKYDRLSRNKRYDFVGTILIFLSGYSDILKVKENLENKMSSIEMYAQSVEILVAHSSIPLPQLTQLLAPRQKNWRIILSTDICETSITVPNVTLVIDTLQRKYPIEGNRGTTILKTDKISKESADQRAGRTARTEHGIVFRLITRENYEKLEPSHKNESSLVSITKDVLELQTVSISPKKFFKYVPSAKIDAAINELRDLKCVNVISRVAKITPAGLFTLNIPLSIRNSLIVYYGIQDPNKNSFIDVITAVALETYRGIFRTNPTPINYPLATILYPFKLYFEHFESLDPNVPGLYNFCEEHNYKYDSFRDAISKIYDIIVFLESIGASCIPESEINYADHYEHLMTYIDKIFGPVLTRTEDFYEGGVGTKVQRYTFLQKYGNVNANKIYALSVYSKFVDKQKVDFIDVCVPKEDGTNDDINDETKIEA